MLQNNLYRYKGRIYSIKKNYKQVPRDIQKTFKELIREQKGETIKDGLTRDDKGRIRKLINGEIKPTEVRQIIKKTKVKEGNKITYKKDVVFVDKKGKQRSEEEFKSYLEFNQRNKIETYSPELKTFNQNIISVIQNKLMEGKNVEITILGKKEVVTLKNLDSITNKIRALIRAKYAKVEDEEEDGDETDTDPIIGKFKESENSVIIKI
jgi:hypothetical protein